MKTKLLLAGAILFAASQAGAEDLVAKGKTVYDGIGGCMACHGPLGAGDGPASAALTPKPRNLAEGDFGFDTDGDGAKGTEADILNILTNGAAQYGGSPAMVGRADIPEADRKALVQFILSLSKK